MEKHCALTLEKVSQIEMLRESMTYMFSSPTMQMADNSFTTSVIIADWLGSMALASKARLFSSPRIRSKPYCNGIKTLLPRHAAICPIFCQQKYKSTLNNKTKVKLIIYFRVLQMYLNDQIFDWSHKNNVSFFFLYKKTKKPQKTMSYMSKLISNCIHKHT